MQSYMAKRSDPKDQKTLTGQQNLTFYDLYNYIRRGKHAFKKKRKTKTDIDRRVAGHASDR